MSEIIGVDVDECVLPSGTHWLNWLQVTTGSRLFMPMNKKLSYDLTVYFREELKLLGMDGYSFWRQKDLYDELKPHKESVEVLGRLHEEGYKIVFVSTLKGDHHKSKVNFLKKHFPFMEGFIGTKEKHLVRMDYMIDDRMENLVKQPKGVTNILIESNYEQSLPTTKADYVVEGWGAVYHSIKVAKGFQ